MKTVSSRQANQEFSKLLAEAAAGEEIVITRRGTPIARLIRAGLREHESDRAAAVARLLARLDLSMGGGKVERDELYDR